MNSTDTTPSRFALTVAPVLQTPLEKTDVYGRHKIPDGEHVSDEEWKRWARGEGRVLVGLGIPERVVADKFVWDDFICHGRLEQHPGMEDFHMDQLPDPSKRPLLEILLASYSREWILTYDLVAGLLAPIKGNRALGAF